MNYYVSDKATCPIIMAVSDGHGSAKYFRSNIGSQIAVEVGTDAMLALYEASVELPSLSSIKRTIQDTWPLAIVRMWRESVDQHYATKAFDDIELSNLETDEARDLVCANPWVPYGATLLLVLIGANFIAYLQLGDGDILTVDVTGKVHRPLEPDARLLGNETTSLCSEEAWNDCRVSFETTNGNNPMLILASTDGYSGAFRTESDFLKVGSDLAKLISEDGTHVIETNVLDWINEASEKGSGDDVTVMLAVNSRQVPQLISE